MPLHINALVRESLNLLDHEIRSRAIRVKKKLEDPLPLVVADQVEIMQVLMNLMRNAVESMAVDGARGKELLLTTAREGQFVRTEVIDSGCGWPAGKLDHMFEPFFTTKPNGMGVGLSICRSIISSCGGELTGRVNPAGGAIFSFMLPIQNSGRDV